ncbi:conserved hypothetical protein [Ricinus communis]|uniref:DUF5610 domain-containing protein n=1 Tax=Ricinus communis TaxID=3988 RepID=B9TBC3_RICCO|nr:conserved hypothetical protein [Ricinus communis]
MSQDNTPEGTAGRIVSLSTGFFEAYKQQHPGEDEGELLNKFMDTIKSGMERGFKEAREVLDGMKVLNGDIAANIDKTYELHQRHSRDRHGQDRQSRLTSHRRKPVPMLNQRTSGLWIPAAFRPQPGRVPAPWRGTAPHRRWRSGHAHSAGAAARPRPVTP